MTLKPPTNEKHVGPLKRSLRKAIERDDAEHEFTEKDQLPFRYIMGKSIDKNLMCDSFKR